MKLIVNNQVIETHEPPLLHVVCNITYNDQNSYAFNECSKRLNSTFSIFETKDHSYIFYSKSAGVSSIKLQKKLTDFEFPITLFKNKEFLDLASVSGIGDSARNLILREDPDTPVIMMVLKADVRIFSNMQLEFIDSYLDGDVERQTYMFKGEQKISIVTNVGNEDGKVFSVHNLDVADFSDDEVNLSRSRITNYNKIKNLLNKIGVEFQVAEIVVKTISVDIHVSRKHLNYPAKVFITKPQEGSEIKVWVYGDIFYQKETKNEKVIWFKVPGVIGYTAVVFTKEGDTLKKHTYYRFAKELLKNDRLIFSNIKKAHPLVFETLCEITKKNGINDLDSYFGLMTDEPISGEPTKIHGMNVYGDHKLTIKHSCNRNIHFFEQYGKLYTALVDDTISRVEEFHSSYLESHINDLIIGNYQKAGQAIELLQKHKYIT